MNGNSVNILPATAIQSDGTFFPDTDINAAGPAVQIFTIVNDGTAPLEIDTIGSPSTEFETASLSSFTVNPGVPETFEVRFMPSAVGNFTDDVTITLLGGLPDFVFQVQGNGIDITTPTIDIIGVPPTSFEPFTVTVQFSEGVTGFYDSDIDVTNGSVTSFMYVSDSEYEVEITPAANGQVDISIPDTIAVSTDDGEPNAASAVFSSIYTEPTTPTVVINGAPTNTSGPFDVTFNFSEDVSGFDETDIVLINANIVSSSFTIISPSEYTATIVPVNDGQVTIDVPAGVANATAPGNLPNAAAVQVVVEYQGTPYVAITQEVIASFMINRTNNILANQPSLMNFLKGDNVYGGGKYGNLSGDANAGGYNFNFNTSLSRMRYNQAMQDYYPGQGAMPSAKPKVGNYDVWTQLSGSWAETGSAESNLLNMYIGSHYVFSENFMLGAMLEFDWAEEEGAVGNSQANGFGWLIGPYIVGAIPEYNIFYEAYIGYGHSSNEVNPFGTYVDEFGSKRLFVNAKIGGRIELEELNFDQELSVSYIKDKQETYTDSRGNIIPSQVISVGEAKFGSTVNSTMEFGDAQITPEFGVSGVVNFAVEEGAQPIEMPWDEGVRLRLDTGINYRAGRFDLDGGAFYDGVITDDYNNYGVDFKAKINF